MNSLNQPQTGMQLYDAEGRRLYFTEEERRGFVAAAATAPRAVRTFCGVAGGAFLASRPAWHQCPFRDGRLRICPSNSAIACNSVALRLPLASGSPGFTPGSSGSGLGTPRLTGQGRIYYFFKLLNVVEVGSS